MDKELDSLLQGPQLYRLWLSAVIVEMNQRITDITALVPQDMQSDNRREQAIGVYNSFRLQLGNSVDGSQSWFAELSRQVKQQLKQH